MLFSFFMHVLILSRTQLESAIIILSTIKTIYQKKFCAICMKKSLIVLFSAVYTVLQSFLMTLVLFISGQASNIFLNGRFYYGRINVILLLTEKQHRKRGQAMPVLRTVTLTRLLWLSVIKKPASIICKQSCPNVSNKLWNSTGPRSILALQKNQLCPLCCWHDDANDAVS